ncbi:MAG: nucleotidyltransferase family protein [Sphingobium sp.]|nr:nucleotidyltransferase family protein [Sphingobium sp.]MCP5399048.1 nucleotidyltransferase family protein [Sphingomonas sp.]
MSARLLVEALRDPSSVRLWNAKAWNGVISAARAERLLATLAHRLDGADVPEPVARILADACLDAERDKQIALWEADRAMAVLAPLGIRVILLKGAAYAAAGLKAGEGRMIGDLDILVPRARMDEVEAALFGAGWEWVKPDPYDDAYYRQWMHELPPMIHRERDRMIDVHHTILPLTARRTPDAEALIVDAVELLGGLYVLSPEDRVCHAVAHMLADGDLAGGLRNLWDIKYLIEDIDNIFELKSRAALHGLSSHLNMARRLAAHIYEGSERPLSLREQLIRDRLLGRDGWGKESNKLLGLGFYIRSHWLRMPPLMLMRHLWTKWRKGHRPV